jgi:hypothetical protein
LLGWHLNGIYLPFLLLSNTNIDTIPKIIPATGATADRRAGNAGTPRAAYFFKFLEKNQGKRRLVTGICVTSLTFVYESPQGFFVIDATQQSKRKPII